MLQFKTLLMGRNTIPQNFRKFTKNIFCNCTLIVNNIKMMITQDKSYLRVTSRMVSTPVGTAGSRTVMPSPVAV